MLAGLIPKRRKFVTVLIPLPLYYNPDPAGRRKPVEEEKFEVTAREISEHYRGGGTLHFQAAGASRGFWWDRGIVHRAVLALIEVDIPDTRNNRAWLKSYAKNALLKRFRQEAIYLKFVTPIETLMVRKHKVSFRTGDEETG